MHGQFRFPPEVLRNHTYKRNSSMITAVHIPCWNKGLTGAVENVFLGLARSLDGSQTKESK